MVPPIKIATARKRIEGSVSFNLREILEIIRWSPKKPSSLRPGAAFDNTRVKPIFTTDKTPRFDYI
jgi:hypothetical protein